MPLINGMKMACEPCIRGHRSTKCTHANERLMVPVKKPGRPLSACPHLHSQLCGCSSVTAAIPRKQKCGCGTGTANGTPPVVQPRPVASAIPESIPSPTRVSFRVQKGASSRPGSRKPSFDMSNLERMNMGNINIIPFQSLNAQPVLAPDISNGNNPSVTYVQYANGFSGAGSDPGSGSGLINPLLQPQYPNVPFQSDYAHLGFSVSSGSDAIGNGSFPQLETLEESFAASDSPSSVRSCCASKSVAGKGSLNHGILQQPKQGPQTSCCTSTEPPDLSNPTPVPPDSASRMSIANGNSEIHQYPFVGHFQADQSIYPSYIPQTTIYAYPPSYGSYQHPLQLSEWRKSVMSNMYAQPTSQLQSPNGLATFPSTSDGLPSLDTLHTCSCGDGCQCVGCAAHPYNNATQEYVRSAYKMANESSPTSTNFTNGNPNGIKFSTATDASVIHANGNSNSHSNEDTSNTPSDTSTVEEQTLSASDYFFVNYPFTGDGCGGDTNSCPCGDDCECIGCTIHRLDPPNPVQAFHLDSLANGNAHVNGSADYGSNDGYVNVAKVKNEDPDDKAPAKNCCG